MAALDLATPTRTCTPGAPVRFGVLGPLGVWGATTATDIPAAKHRTVLAVLLVNANRSVTADSLISELWEDGAPKTARKTLQGYVWRLRAALGSFGERLKTVPTGYRLAVPSGGLDALMFERLVSAARVAIASGRRQAAVHDLLHALELWRGPAFVDVAPTPLVAAHAAMLNEARLAAAELLIDTRLALRSHREVIPELIDLAILHPGRESVYQLLMTALYLAGRQADALAVYGRLRDFLIDEYGLEPNRRTRWIQEHILRGEDGSLLVDTTPQHRANTGTG